MDRFFGDFIAAAAKGLGVSTGEDAAKTVGQVFRDTTPPSPPPSPAQISAAATQTPTGSVRVGSFDVPKPALIAVGVLLVALVLLRGRK